MFSEHCKFNVFTYEQQEAIIKFIEYFDSNYSAIDSGGNSCTATKVFREMLGIDDKKLELERAIMSAQRAM